MLQDRQTKDEGVCTSSKLLLCNCIFKITLKRDKFYKAGKGYLCFVLMLACRCIILCMETGFRNSFPLSNPEKILFLSKN